MTREVELERAVVCFAPGAGSRHASVHHGARIAAREIREVRCDRFPPELVLASGEVLFLPRRDESALDLFARANGIPRVSRHDVWADLLEPYLDTEHDVEHQARTLARLAQSGFEREEVETLRGLVGEPMLRYNAVLWDWTHLGHLDLLAALPDRTLRDFYARSMEIANRGRVLELTGLSAEERLRLKWYEVESAVGAPVGSTAAILTTLLERYGEQARAYHDLRHLLAVVSAVEVAGLDGRERGAALLAAWFHDAVYRPGATTNEEESAELLVALAGPLVRDRRLLEEAAELVRGTALPIAPKRGAAERALADADLAILAEEPSVYRAYAAAIRREHAALAEEPFRAGRAAFLREVEAALTRGSLFHGLHPLHEALARENVAAELAALTA